MLRSLAKLRLKLLDIICLLNAFRRVAAIKPANNNHVELVFYGDCYIFLSKAHALGLFRLYLFKAT